MNACFGRFLKTTLSLLLVLCMSPALSYAETMSETADSSLKSSIPEEADVPEGEIELENAEATQDDEGFVEAENDDYESDNTEAITESSEESRDQFDAETVEAIEDEGADEDIEDEEDVSLEAAAAARYDIEKNVAGSDFGSLTVTGLNATMHPYAGSTVRLLSSPNYACALKKLNCITESGTSIPVTRIEGTGEPGTDSVYQFVMPESNVTINATYAIHNWQQWYENEGWWYLPTGSQHTIFKETYGSEYGSIVLDGYNATMYPYGNDLVEFRTTPKMHGTLVRVSCVTASGGTCELHRVSGSGAPGTESIYAFIMPDEDVAIRATFEQLPRYSIAKNYIGGNNGTVTIIGEGATLYPYPGDTVRFRTSPKMGYKLTRMSYTTTSGKTVALKRVEGSGKAGTNSVYEFTMPAENVTLNATFAENHRTITKSIVGNGQLMLVSNGNGKATMYPKPGEKVRFKSIPASGNKIYKCNYYLSETGKTMALTRVAGTTNVYEFTMPNENVTLNGHFVPKVTPWKKAGTYVVGKDIDEGEYLVVSGKGNVPSYYGTFGYAIVTSNSPLRNTCDSCDFYALGEQYYLRLEEGMVLEVGGGAKFVESDLVAHTYSRYLPRNGMYLAGEDCPAGVYMIERKSTLNTDLLLYVAVYGDGYSGSRECIHDEYDVYETSVVVHEGEYLYLENYTAQWIGEPNDGDYDTIDDENGGYEIYDDGTYEGYDDYGY